MGMIRSGSCGIAWVLATGGSSVTDAGCCESAADRCFSSRQCGENSCDCLAAPALELAGGRDGDSRTPKRAAASFALALGLETDATTGQLAIVASVCAAASDGSADVNGVFCALALAWVRSKLAFD